MRQGDAGMSTRRSVDAGFDTPNLYFFVELASVDARRSIADAGRSLKARKARSEPINPSGAHPHEAP